MFPNSVIGITGKTIQMTGCVGVARYMDLGQLVQETDSPRDISVDTRIMW